MPRKGPLRSSRKQYSCDLKELIIYQTKVLRLSTTEVAINLNMPVRVFNMRRRHGRKSEKFVRVGSIRAVSVITLIASILRAANKLQCQCMIGLIKQSPDIFLDEFHHQLYEMHGIDVSFVHCCMHSQMTWVHFKEGIFIAFLLSIWLIVLHF